ncbi:MAG: choice-of-anchor tandem repeat GloVer-containing protein [Rhizomicrobium sp.]
MTMLPSIAAAGFAVGLLTAWPATAATYQQLYAFKGGTDGYLPYGGVTDVDGTLYGTTEAGGGGGGGGCCGGWGTVFKVTMGGTETVLFAFRPHGGRNPSAGLNLIGHALYGTTFSGGPRGNRGGVVFRITPAARYRVLYDLTEIGARGPYAAPIDVNGTLYGPSEGRRTCHCDGMVYALTRSGEAQRLYAFQGGNDGDSPDSNLTNIGGTLYGTTSWGSGSGCGGNGCGTVYAITTAGHETVLHAFGNGSDGAEPIRDAVTNVGGTLYGTTEHGGGTSCYGGGCGTVYAITTSGQEAVLHAFQGGSDGAYPFNTTLLNVGGTLYGTTGHGGGDGCGGEGCGTVFAITTSGQETILYAFQGGSDGSSPSGKLAYVDGTVYGTTVNGGGSGCSGDGCGTVYAITP